MAFGMKKAAAPKPVESKNTGLNAYLGVGTRFEGRMEFTGTAQISGVFIGEIVSEGILLVGQEGTVEGTVTVASLNCAGKLTGSVKSSKKASLQRTAECTGDIEAQLLEMDEGARFEGNISMRQAGTTPQASTVAPKS
jgi:cytoskeletal protein CcmA (bactofilin family)